MRLLYFKKENVHIRKLEKLEAGIKVKNTQVKTVLFEIGGHTVTVAAFNWAKPATLPVKED